VDPSLPGLGQLGIPLGIHAMRRRIFGLGGGGWSWMFPVYRAVR
jgi:hypothetical protein